MYMISLVCWLLLVHLVAWRYAACRYEFWRWDGNFWAWEEFVDRFIKGLLWRAPGLPEIDWDSKNIQSTLGYAALHRTSSHFISLRRTSWDFVEPSCPCQALPSHQNQIFPIEIFDEMLSYDRDIFTRYGWPLLNIMGIINTYCHRYLITCYLPFIHIVPFIQEYIRRPRSDLRQPKAACGKLFLSSPKLIKKQNQDQTKTRKYSSRSRKTP